MNIQQYNTVNKSSRNGYKPMFICWHIADGINNDMCVGMRVAVSNQAGVCACSGCGLPQSAYQAAQNLRQVEKRI